MAKLTTVVPEYEGIHVDVWYDRLEHLAGQHIWIDDSVYRILRDQPEGSGFNLDNAKLVESPVLLYEDENKTLETIENLYAGDLILKSNKLYRVTEDKNLSTQLFDDVPVQRYQAKPIPFPEYEGVHVDVWYDELNHLAGQHVWKDNVVYKLLKDQPKDTKFDINNTEFIVGDVFLYGDRNTSLPYVKDVFIGDLVLDYNRLYSMQKDNVEFPEDGIVIIASKEKKFYKAAIELAESIKLFWEDAHITLFVDTREWIEPEHREVVDWIVHHGVPKHIRAKLWALGNTPYKGKTCYVDADMTCQHEDISKVFEQLPDDLDLIFTKIRPYNAKLTKLTNTEEMTMHCGMFIYRNNPQTIKLMRSWYGEYLWQLDKKNDIGNYPDSARKWDTFTMWKLLTYGDTGVRWDENLHVKWNFINGHKFEELEGEEIILYHFTLAHHLKSFDKDKHK